MLGWFPVIIPILSNLAQLEQCQSNYTHPTLNRLSSCCRPLPSGHTRACYIKLLQPCCQGDQTKALGFNHQEKDLVKVKCLCEILGCNCAIPSFISSSCNIRSSGNTALLLLQLGSDSSKKIMLNQKLSKLDCNLGKCQPFDN